MWKQKAEEKNEECSFSEDIFTDFRFDVGLFWDLSGLNLEATLYIDSTYGLHRRRFSPKKAENIPEESLSS